MNGSGLPRRGPSPSRLPILWASVLSADAAIDLHVDGRVITSESALALLGSGLGLSLPALEDEFGFIVDDSDFPVVALRYGERVAVVVADADGLWSTASVWSCKPHPGFCRIRCSCHFIWWRIWSTYGSIGM